MTLMLLRAGPLSLRGRASTWPGSWAGPCCGRPRQAAWRPHWGSRGKKGSPGPLPSSARPTHSTASLWALSLCPSSGMKSYGPAGPGLEPPLGLPLRPELSPPSSAAQTAGSPQPPRPLHLSFHVSALSLPTDHKPSRGHPRLLPPPLFGVDERGSPAQGQLAEDKGQGGESPTR